jgi:hypothetical protein
MICVPANLLVTSCVFLTMKMTVAIGQPLHYSSAERKVTVYNNAFESLLFISGNCKIVHVAISVHFSPSSKKPGIPSVFPHDNP